METLLVNKSFFITGMTFLFLSFVGFIIYIIDQRKELKAAFLQFEKDKTALSEELKEKRRVNMMLRQKLIDRGKTPTPLTFADHFVAIWNVVEKILEDYDDLKDLLRNILSSAINVENQLYFQEQLNKFINKHELNVSWNIYIHNEKFIICGEDLPSDTLLATIWNLTKLHFESAYFEMKKRAEE